MAAIAGMRAVAAPAGPEQPGTAEQLNQAQRTLAQEDGAQKPSFFHTLLEIFEFAARIMFPIVNLISAAINIGRLIYDVLSGKPDIDWTKELSRIGLDMVGAIPGFGIVGAVGNAALNYWFYEHGGENRQGNRILGGVNTFFDSERMPSSAYYLRQLTSGARTLFSSGTQANADNSTAGAAQPAGNPPPAAGQPSTVSATSAIPDIRSAAPQGGQPQAQLQPQGQPQAQPQAQPVQQAALDVPAAPASGQTQQAGVSATPVGNLRGRAAFAVSGS